MREKSSEILKNRKFHHQRSSSPYDMNEDLAPALHSMHMHGLTPHMEEESFDQNAPGA